MWTSPRPPPPDPLPPTRPPSQTEKLLLYGGAIHEAGEVKARRAGKSATSDWMELEKQRGISITSTALTFNFENCLMNLLDTPGHQVEGGAEGHTGSPGGGVGVGGSWARAY